MLKQLQSYNDFDIISIEDSLFDLYGMRLNIPVDGVSHYMKAHTNIPESGNIYIAKDESLTSHEVFQQLKHSLYGGLDIQVGYCNGNSTKLNALECHIGYEVNVAITDCVLFLALPSDIVEDQIDSSKVKAFYLPAGTVIALHDHVLHFAPCKVRDEGFKVIVVLLDKTNQDIELTHDHNRLFKFNKWLYVHPDRQDLINNKAKEGITGINFEVNYHSI